MKLTCVLRGESEREKKMRLKLKGDGFTWGLASAIDRVAKNRAQLAEAFARHAYVCVLHHVLCREKRKNISPTVAARWSEIFYNVYGMIKKNL